VIFGLFERQGMAQVAASHHDLRGHDEMLLPVISAFLDSLSPNLNVAR
jgi:hypothetical protein